MSLNLIKDRPMNIVCRIDDVDGDETNLVNFVKAYRVAVTENNEVMTTFLGNYTDDSLTTAYTVLGTEKLPEEIGDAALTTLGRIGLQGASWSPSQADDSFSIFVETIGDIANPPTLTDGFGNISPLPLQTSLAFGDFAHPLNPNVTVTAGASDLVFVAFQRKGS